MGAHLLICRTITTEKPRASAVHSHKYRHQPQRHLLGNINKMPTPLDKALNSKNTFLHSVELSLQWQHGQYGARTCSLRNQTQLVTLKTGLMRSSGDGSQLETSIQIRKIVKSSSSSV